VRFGLSLPHYGFSLPGGEPVTFDACSRWALRAEALGFDSVWVSDHFFYSFGRYGADPSPIASLEPMTTLAALAAVTSRVRLGTLVLCTPFRHPSVVAKAAATIDAVSGGRLELGIGAGWLADEFDAFGYPFGSVGERFDDLESSLGILTSLLGGGDPVTLDTGSVFLRDAELEPPPVQRPVPVRVGGKGGPRLLRLAARFGAGWNLVWRVSPEDYANRVEAVQAACDAEGHDRSRVPLSIGLCSLLGEHEAEAGAAFERGRSAMPGGALDGVSYEAWRSDTLSGTPEQAIERIGAFEALGVQELIVSPWVLPFAIPEPEQVELFAERVLMPLKD
jgi:probable F420-dependent oxidoreductase